MSHFYLAVMRSGVRPPQLHQINQHLTVQYSLSKELFYSNPTATQFYCHLWFPKARVY